MIPLPMRSLALFGIDFPELIVILVIALILFGPEKLPEYSQKLGQMVYKWKRAYTNLQRSMYLPPELTRNAYSSDYACDYTPETLCPKCRHRISGDFVFCPACGQRLKEAAAEPVSPPETAGAEKSVAPAAGEAKSSQSEKKNI
jgi:sec-independent protein translocase protein TatA